MAIDPTNVLATQGVTIVSIPIVLQWMKQSQWKIFAWINDDHTSRARAIAWLAGVLAATGIHGELQHVGMVFQARIDLTGLTPDTVMHAALAVSGQLGGQEVLYKILKIADRFDRFLQAAETNRSAWPGGPAV